MFVPYTDLDPVISVPCTFFISSGGVPLEVIPAQCQPDEFIKKAEAVLQVSMADLHQNCNFSS